MCLLILDLNSVRLQVKGKHSAGRKFQSARKETVDIGILVTSRNGDKKIMQFLRIMIRPPSKTRKWNHLSQFRRTSTKVIPVEKTYWLHFNNEPMVHERQEVKDQQSCRPVSVVYATMPSISQERQPKHDNSIPRDSMVGLQRYRTTSRERNFTERIKTPIFMEAFQQQR